MQNESAALIGALVAANISFIANIITAVVHIRGTRMYVDKDRRLQMDKFSEERIRSEVALERQKLEELHEILSKMRLENSQTVSYIHSADDLSVSKFRERYLENCNRLHTALAISDLYYPEMSDGIREIDGESNMFWGHQEQVLRIDSKTNPEAHLDSLSKVIEAAGQIGRQVQKLHWQVRDRGKKLSHRMQL